MATILAPVNSREVVRCDYCSLIQFRASTNNCRRCRRSLDEVPVAAMIAASSPPPEYLSASAFGLAGLAASIRSLRLRGGFSQRQLAGRMKVPRTYISKVENNKATPTLSSLERLAAALDISVTDLLLDRQEVRSNEINGLLKDPFVSEVAPFVSRLNQMQMACIMSCVREMSTKNAQRQVPAALMAQGARPAAHWAAQ